MPDEALDWFACDLCGTDDAIEVPHAREFTDDQPIHICRACGFVHVKRRRPAERIAQAWSEEIFGQGYTAAVPGVVGRLAYVAAFVEETVGLHGRSLAEIGAGEGAFLALARDRYDADVYGVEPSPANVRRLSELRIPAFRGTIEQYGEAGGERDGRFDVVAILWTLENCRDLRAMLGGARRLLKDDGRVVVATGSRLLVPFKKPLWAYLSRNPADTHAFRFSANTLRGALAVAGFETVHLNRFLDSDVLCAVGAPTTQPVTWEGDDPLAVHSFFERWYVDTTIYHPQPAGERDVSAATRPARATSPA
jgi:SAM-dependent methyltransferase